MNKKSFNIALLDDHPLILKALNDFISENFSANIFSAINSTELYYIINTNKIDILITDIELKDDISGIEVIEKVKSKNKTVKIISFTNVSSLYTIKKLVNLHIDGLVFKNCDLSELSNAIESVQCDKKYFCPEAKDTLAELNPDKCEHDIHLTKRESEILKILHKGFTSSQISKKLCISKDTVNSHRKNLLLKFSVKNIAELIAKANKFGLTD
jgi:DNA-binding NarL/FixJ family response regulator